MKLVNCAGRLCAAPPPAPTRSGGKSAAQFRDGTTAPPAQGAAHPATGNYPKSVSHTPSGNRSATSDSVTPDNTVWPAMRQIAQPSGPG